MFTGLVKEVGRVVSLRRTPAGARLTVRCMFEGISIGESISVNGACQTVTGLAKGAFTCDLLQETMRVTNLGTLRPGARVNLERAMLPQDRFGGHIVNGHIDGVGRVIRVSKHPLKIEVSVPPGLITYIVPKGSVALNGVSLTVGPNPRNGSFAVFITPHTWEHTNLRDLRVGSGVNVEVDILAKYVEAMTREGRGENL
jgi:riboflavin synthase